VIFEQNSEKYFMPASNMKNFTVATAIEKLTPDFHFVTSVYAAAGRMRTERQSVQSGSFGRGDVSISTRFSEGNYYKGLDDLAIRSSPPASRRSTAISSRTKHTSRKSVPGEWEWDDLQWDYGAEISLSHQ
jgi:D-alanyl-D-alanine carboxypeptidase/D-alanyl-D-alanine-endopeptidase (penicillin-binding protein 4)